MTARLVRTEIDVPGTPEEVWEAIATGPGIACWFVPAEVDERVGGEIVTHHGPYGDSRGGEEWGDEIDGTEAGWVLGMENLRLYLTHYAGRRCSHALAVGEAGERASRGPHTALRYNFPDAAARHATRAAHARQGRARHPGGHVL